MGLGLRVSHYQYLFEHWPEVDYFEIISDNFLQPGTAARRNLTRASERYPVILHGVGLNLLSAQPLDQRYLERIAELAEAVDAPYVTDHLCWNGAHGYFHHDLLPTPYTPELMEWAAQRAEYVQRFLGRPFGLENLSSYVDFETSTLTEWDFYSSVVEASGCHYMLDINNIYVSSQNHGFDPLMYLQAIDMKRVLQVHVAGHTRNADGTLLDTHDQPVADPVWELYRRAWNQGGPFRTLLEWDERIPAMPVVLEELAKARRYQGVVAGGLEVRSIPNVILQDTPHATTLPPPSTLSTFQAHFTLVVRSELVPIDGRLDLRTQGYPDELCAQARAHQGFGPRTRLGIYNQQYWYRLFNVLQSAFPLVTHLLGAWGMNRLTTRYLYAHPPTLADIDHVSDHFESFVGSIIDRRSLNLPDTLRLPELALHQAARIDVTWRRVHGLAPCKPYAPSHKELATLIAGRLTPAEGAVLVTEHWPLIELRRTVLQRSDETPLDLPTQLKKPATWAICRVDERIMERRLEPLEAVLLRLLLEHSVGEAIARFAEHVPPDQHAELSSKVQRWLFASVKLGFWGGLVTGSDAPS